MSKKLRKLLLFSYFIVLFVTLVKGQENAIKFDHLTIDDGLSQNTVQCVMQDSRGFMWLGTEDGLNLYDGHDFKVYRPDPGNENSLVNNFVNALAEDSTGSIWIATNDGVSQFNYHNDNFINYHPHQIENMPHFSGIDIAIDDQNGVWIATKNNGVIKILPGKEKVYIFKYKEEIQHSISSNQLISIHYNNGYIWCLTADGKLNTCHIDSARFKTYEVQQKKFSAIHFIDDNMMLLGSNKGVFYHFNTMNGSFRLLREIGKAKLDNNKISKLLIGPNGNTWIGTDGGGLYVFDQNKKRIFNYRHDLLKPKSLSHNVILDMFIDDAGIVWIGTDLGGVNKYDPYRYKFSHIHRCPSLKNSLKNNMVYAIYKDQKGFLWIGTYGGWVSKIDPKSGDYKHFRLYPGDSKNVENNTVFTIHESDDNSLWFGTKAGGLYRLKKGSNSIQRLTGINREMEEIFSQGIRDITTGKNGKIWIATYGNGLVSYNYESNNFEHYNCFPANDKAPAHNTLYTVFQDQAGLIWLGTRGGGLKMFNPVTKKFKHYLHNKNDSLSISSNYVLPIHEDENKNLWIGTLGGGLNYFNRKSGKFSYLTKKSGVADIIYGLLQDKNGNLWMSSTQGLIKFNPLSKSSRSFTIKDGLQSNEFNGNACFVDNTGKMYFGGINGLNYFYPSSIKINTYEPEVVFTDFKLYNRELGLSLDVLNTKNTDAGNIFLSYDDDIFTIDFASLHYSIPERIQYRYKMEGFNNNWVNIGNTHTATFTNLEPQNYTFKVQATNSDGIWSNDIATLKLDIAPPFWQTKLFQLLEIFTALLLISLFILIRERRLRKRKIILEKLVRQRTKEISKQKEEIESQHDEIKAQRDEIAAQRDNLEKYNQNLLEQKSEILRHRDEIERKNKNITDSFIYAEKIQQVILPPLEKVQRVFPNSFVLYKPKDIVSGDFYWFEQKNDRVFFSAVDCTGHGVPGALMSIVCHNMLNQALNSFNMTKPSDILKFLSQNVSENLKNTDKKANLNDGMDLALCSYNKKTKELEYAGAFNPLYIIRNNELLAYHGECYSISVFNNTNRDFRNHTIKIEEGDTVYLFSDGFVDQFGGNKRKKFMKKRFKEALLSIQHLNMPIQKQKLENIFYSWKGNNEQIDDVLVIGIKI